MSRIRHRLTAVRLIKDLGGAVDSVDATIAFLAERFPRAFFVWEQRRRPLKTGIKDDILPALGGAVTEDALTAALRRYTSNSWYLRASLEPGTPRLNLDGCEAGHVTDEQAEYARQRLAELEKRRAQARAKAKPEVKAKAPRPSTKVPPPPVKSPPSRTKAPAPVAADTKKRIGLDELRAAAKARQQAKKDG
jgi:sRNA-binding protein